MPHRGLMGPLTSALNCCHVMATEAPALSRLFSLVLSLHHTIVEQGRWGPRHIFAFQENTYAVV